MLDASQFADSIPDRPLRKEEIELIFSFLGTTTHDVGLMDVLQSSRVIDMRDGGMGSIRFVKTKPRVFGKVLREAQYIDVDGVCVSITINTDNLGDLFEVDFWKVDFSPLKRYPKPSDLRFVDN